MSISDERIMTLRREALEHGDLDQVAICDLALDATDGCAQAPEPGCAYYEVAEDYDLDPATAWQEPIPLEAQERACAELELGRRRR